jgi:hypothetical protein
LKGSGKKMKVKAILVLVAVVLGFASTGKAVPVNPLAIKLSDGMTAPVVVFDGSPLDANPTIGAVTYIGSVGGWNLNVTTGIGLPAQGTPLTVDMDLNSVNAGVGTLSVELWNAVYVPALVNLTSAIGGTTDGSVLANVYVDPIPFGHASPIMSLGPFGPGAFSGTASANGVPQMIGYTEEVIITHRERGITSFNMSLRGHPVPDGGLTVAMLGLAVAGLGIVRRRLA